MPLRSLLVLSLSVRTILRIVWSGVGIALIVLLISITVEVVELPRLAVETRGLLLAEIQSTRTMAREQIADALLMATLQLKAIRWDADQQIEAIRTETLARVDKLQKTVDVRTGEALKIVDTRLAGAQVSIDGLRKDLQPVLTNTAALAGNGASLAKDAQDSLDDLYPDIKGTVASATVAVTSAAYASEAVRDAAPKVASSVIGIGKSADGIAADVKREADELTRPAKWYMKILGPAYTLARIVAAFL